MKMFAKVFLLLSSSVFASQAFGQAYLCAGWQAFNADMSQAQPLGGSKCLVADEFENGSLRAGIQTKNGADAMAEFDTSSDVWSVIASRALNTVTVKAGEFFFVDLYGNCLGTNMSGAFPKLDKVGNTQCWIFHIAQ